MNKLNFFFESRPNYLFGMRSCHCLSAILTHRTKSPDIRDATLETDRGKGIVIRPAAINSFIRLNLVFNLPAYFIRTALLKMMSKTFNSTFGRRKKPSICRLVWKWQWHVLLSSSPLLTSLELESAKWSGNPLACKERRSGLCFVTLDKLLNFLGLSFLIVNWRRFGLPVPKNVVLYKLIFFPLLLW